MLDLADQLDAVMPTALFGSVVRTVGMTAAVADFPAPVGALVEIERHVGGPLAAEVIGFRDELTMLYVKSEMAGVRRGNRVRLMRTSRWLRVGNALLGRVIDAHGHAIDDKPQPALSHKTPLDRRPPPAVQRPRIDTPLSTGIRALDGLLTCGKGQRMGIFAGSGVGKSTLLGQITRGTDADVVVVALVGERGREVGQFVREVLGPEGVKKSVLVVATSDRAPIERFLAPFVAVTIAEHFRDQGLDVLLVMDSVTRFAAAAREIGLAAGEPPTVRGYPPSFFATVPKLVERMGRTKLGSITGLLTILVEGDDPNEPVADTLRGLLDGHLFLKRELAQAGHFPAVDVLGSLSRLMTSLVTSPHAKGAGFVRQCLAAHRDGKDLIEIGAYKPGANPKLDLAMQRMGAIEAFLRQGQGEVSSFAETSELIALLAQGTDVAR